MKKIILIFTIAIGVSGCEVSVPSFTLDKMSNACENNGGIYSITVNNITFDDRAICQDGTNVDISKRGK